jgi:hypothetical protein
MPISGGFSDGALGAADIDSSTGQGVPGGDVLWTDTDLAMGKTLMAALGIPQADIDADFIPGAGGAVIQAALV